MVSDQKLSLYLLVAAETFHTSSQFMPDLEKVRDEPSDANRGAVRRGELYGGSWAFFIAIIIAHATNSPVPLAIWLAVTAASFGIYEYHLREF